MPSGIIIHANDVYYLLEEWFIKYPKKLYLLFLKSLFLFQFFFDPVSHVA